jgi:hypothetical protein
MKKLLIAIVAAPMVLLLFVLLLFVMLVVGGLSTGIIGGAPSQDARADIPAGYLVLYQRAADICPGLPWPVLAGHEVAPGG